MLSIGMKMEKNKFCMSCRTYRKETEMFPGRRMQCIFCQEKIQKNVSRSFDEKQVKAHRAIKHNRAKKKN